jgi:hypothetical protein
MSVATDADVTTGGASGESASVTRELTVAGFPVIDEVVELTTGLLRQRPTGTEVLVLG